MIEKPSPSLYATHSTATKPKIFQSVAPITQPNMSFALRALPQALAGRSPMTGAEHCIPKLHIRPGPPRRSLSRYELSSKNCISNSPERGSGLRVQRQYILLIGIPLRATKRLLTGIYNLHGRGLFLRMRRQCIVVIGIPLRVSELTSAIAKSQGRG